MKHSAPVSALALIAILMTASPAAAEPDPAALAEEGKAVMMAFGSQLKGELQAAMKAGGPINAIAVCNEKAVPIAEAVSREKGWTVARTSHKLRNPANAPDAYEQGVLDDFLARQAAGETADKLVSAAVVDGPEGKSFRLIKAIGTEEVCLTCHGTSLKPDVAAKLDELYPGDKARGFDVGQMRGVFTFEKKL